MGGGGLISGIGSVIKAFSPSTKIYGVAAANSKALAVSMLAGKVVETDHLDTLAEGVAGGIDTDTITLPLAQSVVDFVIECTEEEILSGIKSLVLEDNMVVEGSAALALAGFNKVAAKVAGQMNVVVLCGANVNCKRMLELVLS
jgi:threonine dehydratase